MGKTYGVRTKQIIPIFVRKWWGRGGRVFCVEGTNPLFWVTWLRKGFGHVVDIFVTEILEGEFHCCEAVEGLVGLMGGERVEWGAMGRE
jgi:hypothetical protein